MLFTVSHLSKQGLTKILYTISNLKSRYRIKYSNESVKFDMNLNNGGKRYLLFANGFMTPDLELRRALQLKNSVKIYNFTPDHLTMTVKSIITYVYGEKCTVSRVENCFRLNISVVRPAIFV